MPPPGECLATDLRPTIRHTRSDTDRVPAHAIRHANDGVGSIHDLQAHGPTTVPLPGSPRCARSGLAPQRTGCVEPDTPSDIPLIRKLSLGIHRVCSHPMDSPKMAYCGRRNRILGGVYAAIVLKNSAEARFWPVVCMQVVIDGGAHHDGSDGFAGSALLRFQPH